MRRRSVLIWPLAFAALAGFALLLIKVNPAGIIRPCVFRAVTGVPCPACGTVHAFRDLAAGRIGPAFESNPLATGIALLSGAGALAAVLALPWAHRLRLPGGPSRRALFRIGAALVLVNWAYLIFTVLR